MIPRLPLARRANVSFVTAGLAVGGDLSWDPTVAVDQLAELGELGITHIVDVRLEWSDEETVTQLAPDMTYLHLGIDDAGQRVPDAFFDAGTGFALEALSDPTATVLTHCHMGVNRGPSLGFAVLLAQGWDPVDALDAIRDARPIAAIAYAEDALDWHHRRTGATSVVRARQRAEIAAWRRANHLDVASVIRAIRRAESAAS